MKPCETAQASKRAGRALGGLPLRWLGLPLAIGLLAVASTARADDVPVSDAARQHFAAGVNLMQDPDGARYDEAYREFKTAYSDSPSWKILGNLGIAAMKLERDGEAIDAFTKYLKEGGAQIDPDERAQFTRDLQTLQAGVAKLSLESDPPGAMIVDERFPSAGSPVVNRYGPLSEKTEIGVRGGHHRITATVSGFKPSVWEFDTPTSGEHPFKLEKEEAPPIGGGSVGGGTVPGGKVYARPVPTGVYIGLAATVAFAAGGAVVGVMATGKRSDYNTLNGNQLSAKDHADADKLKKDGTTLDLIADGLFGGAVIAAGVTTVLYFTRPTKEVASPRLQLLPTVATNGGGLMLSGRFE